MRRETKRHWLVLKSYISLSWDKVWPSVMGFEWWLCNFIFLALIANVCYPIPSVRKDFHAAFYIWVNWKQWRKLVCSLYQLLERQPLPNLKKTQARNDGGKVISTSFFVVENVQHPQRNRVTLIMFASYHQYQYQNHASFSHDLKRAENVRTSFRKGIRHFEFCWMSVRRKSIPR